MKHENLSYVRATQSSARITAPKKSFYQSWGKRALDVTLALLLLPAIAPVILVLWLIVRCEGTSGFFGHRRIGQNGIAFRCWKIRTMVPEAEIKLASYLEVNRAAAAEWAETQKLTKDPRTTRLGRFLRRTRLDELPQIWNVLRGEMSFVGPRPVTEPELARYGRFQHIYLEMKPGITGIWQVQGRSDGDYEERVRMDRRYAFLRSAPFDLYLIAMTGLVVLKMTGR